MENKEFSLRSTLWDLTEANVSEVYKRNFERWQYRESDEVIVNGEVVTGIEKGLLQLPNKEGKPNIESLTMSCKVGGIPITEMDFIKAEMASFAKKTSNDLLSLKRIEIYLNYLKQRKGDLERKFLTKDWEPLYNDLINKHIKNVSLNDFSEVMDHHNLPNGLDKIVWKTKKAFESAFRIHFKFTFIEFNKCFINIDGNKLHANNKPTTNFDFRSLLKKYS